MRLLILAVLLAPVAEIAAQAPSSEARISLLIDIDPPSDDNPEAGSWIEASGGELPAGTAVREFRMRVTGVEGGWCYPVLGLDIASGYQTAPDWMTRFGSLQGAQMVNWWGCAFPAGDPQPPVWRQPLFQQYVSAALGSGQSAHDVEFWCQPFLTQQSSPGVLSSSTRLWTADAPLWSGAIGGLNKSLWMAILEDLAAGVPNPRMTAFSGGASIRQALLMQSIMATGTTDQALSYLNSSDFKVAASEGWLFLMMQVFAFRAASLPIGNVWDEDDEVPALGSFNPPPRVGLTGHAKVAVVWPEHSGGGVSAIGGVAPNESVFFRSTWATPPVVLTFPTATGVVRNVARAVGSLDDPCRFHIVVPAQAVPGPILYQAGLDAYPVPIGHVTPQVGQ